MKLYVESDGDRHPKDVYLCNDEGQRVATMEFLGNECAMFNLARKLASAFNAAGSGAPSNITVDLDAFLILTAQGEHADGYVSSEPATDAVRKALAAGYRFVAMDTSTRKAILERPA